MKNKRLSFLSALVFLGVFSAVMGLPGHAQNIFLTRDITIGSALPNYVYVGVNAVPPKQTINTNPTVRLIPGGSVIDLYAFNQCAVSITSDPNSAKSAFQTIGAWDTSVVNISGNTANLGKLPSGRITANQNSVVNIHGGCSLSSVSAGENGRINISAGTIWPLDLWDHSSAYVNGGVLMPMDGSHTWAINVYDDAAIHIFGYNLAVTIISKDSGLYRLTGYLEDGNAVNCVVHLDTRGTLNLHNLTNPKIILTGSTTFYAKSVNVDYTLSRTLANQPILFQIYRCKTPFLTKDSQPIGSQVIDPFTNSDDLQKGSHTITLVPSIPLFGRAPLAPDSALPYVVVVAHILFADPTSVTTTYFRKFLLGGLAHGYSFNDSETLAWMRQMKADLLNIAGFDEVYLHDWTKDSKTPQSGMAVKAGNEMWARLCQEAQLLKQRVGHPGDVVDLHLFGHSRGTVVVSQVLADMIARPDPVFQGSYVEATLLDIHPANPAEDVLLSCINTPPSLALVAVTVTFQSYAQDDEITLPDFPGLLSIDIWNQATPAVSFYILNSEYLLNLWGESKNDNKINDQRKIPIQWHDLTSMRYSVGGQNFLVGHTEIHEWYRLFQVDKGLVH